MSDTTLRITGHALIAEGKVLGEYRYGVGGVGVGGCSCGARSPELPSGNARKQWHREHKAAVLAGKRPAERPFTVETYATRLLELDRRVAWVHPTCPCGAPLQLGVDHGDDELGNPLCPTCSGCGCEPEERKTMTPEHLTPEELDEMRPGAVLRDVNGWDAVKGVNGRWYPTDQGGHDTPGTPPYALVHPVPEPDHSMCARLRTDLPDGDPSEGWILVHPNGDMVPRLTYSDKEVRERGYAIPEPEPTPRERAAEVLAGYGTPPKVLGEMARALSEAGLLREDGA